ncbi:MAG: glycoside hydrolase family 3 N-terminal domain-containing protein, partial [Clostridia bacterium]|nr:glycoside hydrolase family 3 N-terminal domain-containing protein [Clostridia bacterium]
VGMFWATLRADPWTQKTLKTGLNPRLAAEATNEMQKYAMENTRLGIPILFAEECPHGHMAIGTTVFPTSIGQSSTWNPSLIQEMAAAIALEARLQGAHIGYGPVLDLAREPRWSRMEETYGEDPILSAKMGAAMVKGFQGNDIGSGVNVVSTLKHFVAYGVPEGGHNSAISNIGKRDLFQNYMLPFKAAVDAGALSIMTAYNSLDGIPCTSNGNLLTNVVGDEWGFNGFYVSDLGAIEGLVYSHRIAETLEQASALALNAGVNVDLGGKSYQSLSSAIQNRTVDVAVVDSAVRRVLKIKFDMGLFENPYVDPEKVADSIRNENHVTLARKVARESVVLLKNDEKLLPLKKNIKSIAVIGPNADNMYNQLGDYTAPQDVDNVTTVLEGIKRHVGKNTQVTYIKGCDIRDTTQTTIPQAVEAARNADVALVVLGGSSARDFKTEYQDTGAALIQTEEAESKLSDMESGEGYDRSTLMVLGKQLELLDRVLETGTPVVVVLIEGRPLNLAGYEEKVSALLTAWYPGQEGGNAISDILFGDYNPAGRLPISVPKSVGQLPVYYNNLIPDRQRYVDGDSKPQFSFGHGLSYSEYEYSNLNIKSMEKNDSIEIKITFDIINKGKFDGDEVSQLYIRDIVGSVVTPGKQLKDFQRVHLKAGETKTITFNLSAEELSLFNPEMQKVVEPGFFSVMIGASSEDIRLNDKFEIKEKLILKQ